MSTPATSTSQSVVRQQQLSIPSQLTVSQIRNPAITILYFIFNFFYILLQRFIVFGFKPPVPSPGVRWDEFGLDDGGDEEAVKPYGRIAIVGAGLTGVSSAAHAISHGFLPTIYEASPGPLPGGIWNHANASSGLQLNSLLYRFHPGVVWKTAFPRRNEILGEITKIWKEYQLESRTQFNTKVTSITRAQQETTNEEQKTTSSSKWIINDGADGVFDAVIVTVGTCGKAKWIKLPGMPDDIGSVERFELPKDKGKIQDEEGEDKNRPKQEDREDERKYEHDHDHGKGKSSKKHDRKREDRKHHDDRDHRRHHENDEDEDDRRQGSSYTYSDVDRESASSPTTSSHPKKSTEKPKERNRESRREKQEREDDRRRDYDEPRRSNRDRDRDRDRETQRPQKRTEKPKPKDPQSKAKHPLPQVRESKEDGSQHETTEVSSQSKVEDTDNTFLHGPVLHSSQLDRLSPELLEGKKVVVIGSGASAVEVVETALERGSGVCRVLAMDDKWIIPRNIFFDTLIAAQPFGRQMPLSLIFEYFLLKTHYRGVEDLIPQRPIFSGTPVVNDEFLAHVRTGRCEYIRCDPIRLTIEGVLVNERGRGSKPGDEGEERLVEADVIVLATGFEKPDIGFLEEGLFPNGYERPDLYLQNFSTEDWTILMTNSAHQNAIGTVGHIHIGMYTRILLALLLDEKARPAPKAMKSWVDAVRSIKSRASGGALSVFMYAELTIWLLLFHLFRPDRIKWVFFITQGWGVYPQKVKAKKKKISTDVYGVN